MKNVQLSGSTAAAATLRETMPASVEIETDPLVVYAHLSDVPLRVEAVLDIVHATAGQLTSLRPGSVIPLSKPAGSALDFYVDRTRLAAGEITVIDDSVSLRIVEL